MAKLKGDIGKYKLGELAGTCATFFCGIVLVYFIVCFSVARALDIKTLQTVTLITAPVLMVAGIAVSAYCNLVYGAKFDKAIKDYIVELLVENATLLHPERNSLSFYLSYDDNYFNLQVNGYKEKITFDFSDCGKLSLSRRLYVLTEIQNRLCITFCRLYERGATYTDVGYAESRKKDKTVYIIKGGVPEKKAYKQYLKNK